MPIIVKKFGGTSVGSIELIRNIAKKIAAQHKDGESIVLVVSAMAKTTDQLFKLAYEVSDNPSKRELDMLLTAGERISMSLLSIALHNEGLESISFTGSQSGVKTDGMHGNARIIEVNAFRINEELTKGKVVIVAGFQGVSPTKEITTLGRGGSDTSAVALACYLKASNCEIFTDVDGVYSADPRIVTNAKKLEGIDYETMLTLAYSGSKVLHPRACEFALKYQIPVEIKSSFSFDPGTIIDSPENLKSRGIDMEERIVTAIAHKEGLIKFSLELTPNLTQALSAWTTEIFKYRVNGNHLDILIEKKYEQEIEHLIVDQKLVLVSKQAGLAHIALVGLGVNLDPSILAQVLTITSPYQPLYIDHGDKSIGIDLEAGQLSECLLTLHKSLIEEKA